MRTYTAKRVGASQVASDNPLELWVEADGRALEEITPQLSQRVFNHSPNGFECGYGGSGPSQLSLAILLDYFGSLPVEKRPAMMTAPDLALAYYQNFKWRFIAPASRCDGFKLTAEQIAAWLESEVKA